MKINFPILETGEGNGTPLQYSCLENPMDGGAWWAAVHGVVKNRTRLSDFTFTLNFHALDKEMATQSSDLPWRIPGTAEPSGLLSMGSHRVEHNWRDSSSSSSSSILEIRRQKIRQVKQQWLYNLQDLNSHDMAAPTIPAALLEGLPVRLFLPFSDSLCC